MFLANTENTRENEVLNMIATIKKKITITLAFILIATLSVIGQTNVVLIMVDDMGFGDLGCYGSEIKTPNIDKLAYSGTRFTNFTNAGRCCPSRASLLTGLYPHAAGMGWMTAVDEGIPAYQGQLRKDSPTIAEILKNTGYATYMSGKWHLTVDASFKTEGAPKRPNGSWPYQRGFDRYYGGLAGGGGHFKHNHLVDQDSLIDASELPENFYYTHEVTKRSVDFIATHNFTSPMFLYTAYYAPHRPLEAPKDRIDLVRDRYKVGFDVLRRRRFEAQKECGVIPADALYSKPYGEPPSWEDINATQQENWIEEMATYAAMIEIVDDGVGEIVAELKRQKQFKNTLFLFLSDNGATAEGGFISQLAADLSNAPYINYKKHTHLGGVSSPLILNWQGGNFENKPELLTHPVHIIDLLPTILDASDIEFPDTFLSKQPLKPHGVSLMPLLYGRGIKARPLFWEHEGNRAVRIDNWRLVSDGINGEWELYDVSTDPFEQSDLASNEPDRVRNMAKIFDQWTNKMQAKPLHYEGWKARIKKYKKINPEQSGDHIRE